MSHEKWYGVNLGNWLLIETWMAPSLLEGVKVRDEYSLAQSKGSSARDYFDRHRETFITEADFQFLQNWGSTPCAFPWGTGSLNPMGRISTV